MLYVTGSAMGGKLMTVRELFVNNVDKVLYNVSGQIFLWGYRHLYY